MDHDLITAWLDCKMFFTFIMHGMTVEEFGWKAIFGNALSECTVGAELYVSIASSSNESQLLPSKAAFSKNYRLECSQIALLFQKTTGDLVVIAALTSQIYSDGNEKICYIEYVDTTGSFSPRSMQSSVTKSFVSSYIKYAIDCIGVSMFSIFASPKASLIFKDSEKMQEKKPISGQGLISWWISCLAQCKDLKVFVKFPGEESFIKKLLPQNDNWSIGLPFDSDANAIDILPVFRDDPKFQHFSTLFTSDDSAKKQKVQISVQEFFESIFIRPEFKDNAACFFYLKPHVLKESKYSVISDNDTYSKVMDILNTSMHDANCLIDISKRLISSGIHLTDPIHTKEKKPLQKDVEKTQTATHINNVQSFIKRKK